MKKPQIRYIDTKIGKKTIEIDGYIVHSKYNPEKEAEAFAKKEYKENYLHILFGFGMGYIAESLLEILGDSKDLIIVEPFKEFLNINDESVYSTNALKELEEEVRRRLNNYSREVKIICSPNYDKIAQEEYRDVLKVIKDIQYSNIVGENTVRFHSEDWQENYIKNIVTAIEDESLYALEKKFDIPVVIASGGPSLTKQIPKLRAIRDKIILIASGSTINSLEAENIEPDFIVTVDGSISNYNHFKDLKNNNSILLYALSSHYKIQEEYAGKRYPFLTTDDLKIKQLLKRNYNLDLPLIAGGGSVANFAFVIAMFISNGPIALIGQDLAYTSNKSHAETNHQFQEVNKDFLKSRGAFEVDGYYGDKVKTDYPFNAMKIAFENLKKQLHHIAPIYNCTEGGVKINGIDQITFIEFIEMYVKDNKKEFVYSDERKKLPLELVHKLESEVTTYVKIEKCLSDSILALKLSKNSKEFSKTSLKRLEKNDTIFKELISEVMIDRILEPLTIDVMRNYKPKQEETNIERFERVYNKNLELYSRLQEVTVKSKEFTIDTLNKVKNREEEM